MAILQLWFKDAKEYEKKGIIEIIRPHNAIKDDDIVKVTTTIGSRRSDKTVMLKELLSKTLS